ncbi:cytochrome-c peroxidase [Pseudanabaena sp. PCC 6802]|uniref:cytochrome-c peroxidase n=1 Tax=Pseudanabaena sp. PCC 6802 TaxID=118173 RepID=UPI0003458E3E|nr:cytochrome c peroxidase [Pseudanabaena sp. PCC 6802]
MGFLFAQRRVRQWLYPIALIAIAFLVAIGCQQFQIPQPSQPQILESGIVSQSKEAIQPIPLEIALDRNKVGLGEKLFGDIRLSGDRQVSCLSCHNLGMGGVDRRTHSVGVNGAIGEVNTPTVFNVRYNFYFNWNGKFENLTDHLEALMTSPKVMGTQWEASIRALQQDPEYVRGFTQIYPDGLTPNNIKDAIVTYEQSLFTPNSRFDQFLRGNKQALTASEQEGYQLFKAYGCANCHQGANVGGNMFARFGNLGDYFADRGNLTQADLGRFNVTQDRADRFVFRVPSLRNVAITPPYFHDGSVKTLEEAIAIMAKYQLGRSLPQEKIAPIAQFLHALTGEYRGQKL